MSSFQGTQCIPNRMPGFLALMAEPRDPAVPVITDCLQSAADSKADIRSLHLSQKQDSGRSSAFADGSVISQNWKNLMKSRETP